MKNKLKSIITILLTISVSAALLSCGEQSPSTERTGDVTEASTTAPTDDEPSEILLEIEDAEGAVGITIKQNDQFAGCRDTVQGDSVTHGGAAIVDSVLLSAGWDDHFGATYSVLGVGLKQSVICFEPPVQVNDPIECGVNYYDLIMRGSAYACKQISILYGQSVTLEAVTGEFKFYLFTLSKHCPMQFGTAMITLSGSTEQSSNITLTWDGTQFSLVSDSEIANCTVTAEDAYHTVANTAKADSVGKQFTIKLEDGIPSISENA